MAGDIKNQYEVFGTNQPGEVPQHILERRQKQIDESEKLKSVVRKGAVAAVALGVAAGVGDVVHNDVSHPSPTKGQDAVIAQAGQPSSALRSGGKSFIVKNHPAGAEIVEKAPNGEAVPEYVAWDQLTRAQQQEALYLKNQPK